MADVAAPGMGSVTVHSPGGGTTRMRRSAGAWLRTNRSYSTLSAGPARAVRLLSVQREGKGVQDAATFLRGFPLAPGTRLVAAVAAP